MGCFQPRFLLSSPCCLEVSFLWGPGLSRLAPGRDQHSLQVGEFSLSRLTGVYISYREELLMWRVYPLQTSVKMKLLCAQVVKDILGDSIDVRPPPSHCHLFTSPPSAPYHFSSPPSLSILLYFHLISYIFPSAILCLLPSYDLHTLSPSSLLLPTIILSQLPYSILSTTPQYGKVGKLTADAKYEDSDIKAAIAALSFIFTSAAKHSVAGDTLDNELQQLGLPKGVCYSGAPLIHTPRGWKM